LGSAKAGVGAASAQSTRHATSRVQHILNFRAV
jgi:hypothetical protein